MAKKKYRYKKRAFLNASNHHLRAHIIADVPKNGRYCSPTLEIADCSRSVNLDFDIPTDKKGIKIVEKKLDLFLGIINDWAKAMREEIDSRKDNKESKLVDYDD